MRVSPLGTNLYYTAIMNTTACIIRTEMELRDIFSGKNGRGFNKPC